MLAIQSQGARQIATINGQVVALSPETSIAELLVARGLAGKRIAVERNGEIVPRSDHGSTIITNGDEIEIVIAVGGG